MKKLLGILVVTISLVSCTSVKEYQKVYVNDKDMKVSAKSIEQYENNMTTFREGAAGANGAKSGGGCACN